MDTFEKILRAKEKKERQLLKRQRTMYLGNTESGRSITTGKLITDDASVSRDHSSWNIREYKAKPGCVKGRGKLGGY